ncbi:XRE family transcriptional regulator [Phormidium sp. CLA17]|uniref:helix-turn-helix domain-containing protein n=1 Tax=Leptolyngbya sp. Cla-17 TaxID=2803751 RepID=UPI001492DB06|nr:XRE family transcriptional regulator [Leptolyngbya sp. Cla-17]MBM0742320.1 XRE family transcriptional regulator [Leptolyngbya sp. Cla-17]
MTETMIIQAADNIFLDLGFSDQEAENLLIRAKLMLALQTHIRQQNWTIAQAADHLNQSSDEITALTQGKIGRFSVDTLITFLNQVGMTVHVEVLPKAA